MGFHKTGQVSIGAFVEVEIRDYLDKIKEERGFKTRSDAIKLVITEHMIGFSNRTDRNPALTPQDIDINGDYPMHDIHAYIDNMSKRKKGIK